MRFTVPQFIDREAKIMGPFTFKQFAYVFSAGIICVFTYFILPPALFFIIAIVSMGTALALAMVKVGGKSLPTIFLNFTKFKMSPTTYVWQNNGKALDEFSKDGIAIGEIEFENPNQIKKIEETELNKLTQKHQ